MSIAGTDIPFLPRGVRLRHCDVRKAWFLLAPERAVKLDPVGAHVLGALDGSRDFAAVVAHLAEKFDAPAERIAADAGRFLDDMRERRMVEITPAPGHPTASGPDRAGVSRQAAGPGNDDRSGLQKAAVR